MPLRIFTLRFNPATESFDDSPITSFLGDKEVISIRDHFFVKDGTPYLSFVVRYRLAGLPAPAETAQSERKRNDAWRKELSEADWPLFNTLRDWRSERCKQEGIPPYVICNNQQLAEVVKARASRVHAIRPMGAVHGLRSCDDNLLKDISATVSRRIRCCFRICSTLNQRTFPRSRSMGLWRA
jgi:ATP-dependent DNA helicase RecQ